MALTNLFKAKRSAALANPVAATVFLDAAISTAPCIVKLPLQFGTSVKYRVTAWGRATGGTTTNFLPVIQQGTSITAGSNTDVFAPTTRAYNTASANWFLQANFIWDSTSQVITCSGESHGGATIGAGYVAGISTTSQNLATTNASYVVSGIFSATDAANVCFLEGLELEIMSIPRSA